MRYFIFIVAIFFLFCVSGCIDSAVAEYQVVFEIIFLLSAFFYAGSKLLKLK
jgi:hypothetical protein